MMLRTMRGLVAASLLLAMTSALRADDKPAESTSARQQILALLTRMETNFARDTKGLAACWTPNGELIGPQGARADGRETIEKLFQVALAEQKDAKLALHLEHFRLANDSLAFVDAIADMKPSQPGGTRLVAFVIVKQDGQWLIESARETIAHEPPQAVPLKDLQWMAGDWASAASPAGIMLRANCDWTMNHGFLIRKFQVQGKETFLHGGTEVIGWDPRTSSIRSWVFDSDGGFGENTWVRDGNRWLVKFTGTLADGSNVSATQVITKVDDETVTLQSKDRALNGIAQPDIPEVTLKRQTVKALPEKMEKTPSLPEKSTP